MKQIISRALFGSNDLIRGSAAAFAIHAFGVGLTYLSQLALARLIGTASYGVYAYVLGLVTLLAYLAALGFDVSLLRFVSAYRSQQAWGLVRGVVRYAEQRSIVVGMAIAVAGALIVAVWRDKPSSEVTPTFLAGFWLVPVYALLWIRCAKVRAFGGVASSLIPDRMLRDGLLLGAILLASVLPAGHFGAPAAMVATLCAAVAGLALITLIARRRVPRFVAAATPEQAVFAWRRTAIPLIAIAMAEVVINRTGTLTLTWAGHPSDAGIYSLAFNLTAIVSLPRIAVNAQFAPMVADHVARGNRTGLQALVNQATLWTMLGATGIAGAVLFMAGPLMLQWFGNDFAVAIPALTVLLGGQVVASTVGSQLFLLTMSGHEALAATVMAIFSGASLVAGVMLAPGFGLIGAAVATSLALVGMNAVMALLVWRRLRLLPGFIGFLQAPARTIAAGWAFARSRTTRQPQFGKRHIAVTVDTTQGPGGRAG